MAGPFTSLGSVLDLTTEGSSSVSEDLSFGKQTWLTAKRRVIATAKRVCTRHTLIVLALGQLGSLLLCGSGVFSELLQERHVSMAAAQCLLVYMALAVSYTMRIGLRRERNIVAILKERGWKYFLIAVCDVEAHYTVVKAYEYTTVMNVQLLCCFAIPVVLIISRYAMRVQYGIVHLVGVLISLAGVMTLVGVDFVHSQGTVDASDLILGDLLVVLSATLYAVTDLFCEFVSKKFDTQEYMGMIGLFGTVICGIQMFALEHEQIVKTVYTYDIVLYLVGFVTVTMALYVLYSYALTKMNAAALNLNLLCTDFYALLAGTIIFHNTVHPLTYLAFFLIIVGVVIYYTRPTKVMVKPRKLKTVSEKVDEQCMNAEKQALAAGEAIDTIELTEVVVQAQGSENGRIGNEQLARSGPLKLGRDSEVNLEALMPADFETESGLGVEEEDADVEKKAMLHPTGENDSDCGSSSVDSPSLSRTAGAAACQGPEADLLLANHPKGGSV